MKKLFSIPLFIFLGLSVCGATLLDFDGSFETTPAGESKNFRHWNFYSPVPHISTVIVSDAPANTPIRKALKVDYSQATATDNSRSFYSDYLPIDPKLNYNQRVWLKTGGKSDRGFGVNLGRHFYDAQKKLIPYPGYHAKSLMFKNQGPTQWTMFQQLLTPQKDPGEVKAGEIPVNAAYVRIYFNSYGYNRTYTITGHEFTPASGSSVTPCSADALQTFPVKTGTAPDIDGKLNDPVWNQPENQWYSGFRRTICKPEFFQLLSAGQTRFKLWKNDKNLIIAINAASSAPEKIVSAPRKLNDGKIFADETVEIHLDITGSRNFIYQLTVNPDGSCAQYFNKVPRQLPVKIAACRTDNGWDAEIAIPLPQLWTIINDAGGTPNDLIWNLNVCRTQPGTVKEEQFSAWNPTGFYFFNPEAMGVILLDSPKKVLNHAIKQAADAVSRIDWKTLAVQNPNPALQDELTELKKAALIPAWYLQQLQTATEITPSAFAANFRQLQNFEAILKKQIATYQAHNFVFPEEKMPMGCFFTAIPLCNEVVTSAIPENGKIADKFQLTAAGNEIAELRLRLFAGNELKNLRFNCSDLTGGNGSKIPASAIDLRIITPWGSGHQADILATDLRIPFKGFLANYADAERFIPQIPAGECRDLLLMIRTAPGQKPGIYHGKLTVAPEGKRATELDIAVKILPFDLLPARKNVGFYSHAVIFDPQGPAIGSGGAKFYNGKESETSFAEMMKMLNDFGFNFVIQVAYRNGPLSPEYCRTILELMSKAGIKRTALMGAEHLISPAAIQNGNAEMLAQRQETLRSRAKAVAESAKALGFDRFYIYGFDEPNDEAGIRRNNIIFNICRELQIPTLVSCIFEDIRTQIKNLDTVVMSYQSMTSQNHKLLHHAEPGLDRMYYCNLQSGFDPAVRLTFGWYLEKSGFDGSAPWALYYLAQYWDPFRDFHASGEDYANNGCYIFITEDKPLPTMKFIAAHAGVTDLRYIETLHDMLEKCPDPAKKQALQKRFNAMLEHFELTNPQHNQSRNFKLPAALYDQLREELQNLILEAMPRN